jgi:hypothetical protein
MFVDKGLVAQRKSAAFARRRPWVQIPASPFDDHYNAPEGVMPSGKEGLAEMPDEFVYRCNPDAH